MKNFLLFVSFLYVLGSCRDKNESPQPSVYPELQIKAIHFPGIPDENVTIDPLKWTIHVKIPAALSATHFIPTLELSDEAQLYDSSELTELSRVYRMKYPNEQDLSVRIKSKTSNRKITYTIKTTPSAPLKITQTEPLVDFVIGDSSYININAENTAGNAVPQMAIFRNKKSGTEHTLNFNSIGALGTIHNRLRLSAGALHFELGEYELSFLMVDGTELKVGPTVRILQGKPSLNMSAGSSMIRLVGKDLAVGGINLFENTVTFRLHYPNGTTVPLQANYSLNGRAASLSMISSLAPGYYGIEILRDNRPLGISYRLSILKNDVQTMIMALNNLPFSNYPSAEPMVLARNQRISVHFNAVVPYGIYGVTDKYVMTYTDESKPTSVFRFPITIPNEATPHFTIPADVPPGRYKAIIQEINPATKEVVQQSEPFERIVVLQ